MSYNLCIAEIEGQSKKRYFHWIEEMKEEKLTVITQAFSKEAIHIHLVEVSSWYDWVRLARLKKYSTCYYIVILHEQLYHTSPMAVRLGVQAMLLAPVKKSAFYRAVREALKTFEQEALSTTRIKESNTFIMNGNGLNETLEHYMLRRFLHGDMKSEKDTIKALSLFHKNDFPNIVCYVKGFIYLDYNESRHNEVNRTIYASFQSAFQDLVPGLYFLPYRKSLIVLFRKTENSEPLKNWKEGRRRFERIVKELFTEFGVQLYIGIGSLYDEPEMLQVSFQEAKIARNSPPYREVTLRYFEELSRDTDIVKSTKYIEDRFTEEITARETADYVNLSYSYFVRLFRKETGNTFSEYVTFIRLREAVWMLRNTTKTIEEISDAAGFNTPNYFSSTFKKAVGLTPREFRETRYLQFS